MAPAQALFLLNDPFVAGQARLWSQRASSGPTRTPRERIDELYQRALGRQAAESEERACLRFLESQSRARESSAASPRELDMLVWADLCHALFNMKEFIFID
jgi:hypothetical protein